ncbi:MAG: hypothetical protein JSU92_09945 [Deltaproteobacteria bacterium]|nr:MAG: hypothetical protein JSU92_09945 [Deltaproteobacteria bacterium]
MKSVSDRITDLRLLIIIPVLTYIISYLYLAYYHGKYFIFNTIVHEGGEYTLLQDLFYASHFLGHIPVLTMLAFLFAGSYLCLTGYNPNRCSRNKIKLIVGILILFLILSILLSLVIFGYEDTFDFICQKKQGVSIYEEGGSWNLHLPSSILLFLLIPVYLYIFKKIFGRGIELNSRGSFYISLGFIFFFIFTFLLNKSIIDIIFRIWGNPRYLAHSVRELLTFPVTYFPVPLYFFLRGEGKGDVQRENREKMNFKYFILCLAVVFLLGLCYQSYVSLSEGIGGLAQKPYFAKGGSLGIPYLLASHYFEHFLDTVYFTILCLLLYSIAETDSGLRVKD